MAKTNKSSFICIVKFFPLLDRFYWLCYSLSGNSFPSNINHEILLPFGVECSRVKDSEHENRVQILSCYDDDFFSGSLHLLVAETCTSILTIIIFQLQRVLTWNSYYIGAEGIPQSKLNLLKILQALQQAFFFEAAFSVPTDSVKAS